MVVDSPSDQGIPKVLLEGEYIKKKELILWTKKERWPSDWSYLSIVWSICQNLGISLTSYLEYG